MNRSDLIQRIFEKNPDLLLSMVDEVLKTLLEQMTETLISGGRIEIRGFGSFSTRAYEARQVRNPKTGEKVSMPARRLPHFKPGKPLRDSVNGSRGEATHSSCNPEHSRQ
jgi:integration host factor subunit beta